VGKSKCYAGIICVFR